jgi:hypothetical protein
MNMARVRDGIVINLEVHDDEGGDIREDAGDLLVRSSDENQAYMDFPYDYETGRFSQPEPYAVDHPLNEINRLVEAALAGE